VITTVVFGKGHAVKCGLQTGMEPGTHHNPKYYLWQRCNLQSVSRSVCP